MPKYLSHASTCRSVSGPGSRLATARRVRTASIHKLPPPTAQVLDDSVMRAEQRKKFEESHKATMQRLRA